MKNNRLKLYDDYFRFVLDYKSKNELKRLAYRNKVTMSEYIRKLIAIDLLKHKQEILNEAAQDNIRAMLIEILKGAF